MPGIVIRTDAEWRRLLTPEQYRVTRRKGTEPAHSGWYRDFDGSGTYCCACCGSALFSSRKKFKAPSTWPAFWAPIAPKGIAIRREIFRFVIRSEVLCSRCDAHLGYRVEDGRSPTKYRYLINSVALSFEEQRDAEDRQQWSSAASRPPAG